MGHDLGAIAGCPHAVVSARVSNFDIEPLRSWLSDSEKARAARFRQRADVQRFILAHSLKRFLLAEYLSLHPRELSFGVNDHGKPFCQQKGSPCFNVSHSNDWVVIGVSSLSDIGVDVEFPRDIDYAGIVDRVCDPAQLSRFTGAGSTEEMFLCFWTQKEAVAKACGKGISVGLSEISCSGCLGNEELTFLQQRYWLWTQGWRDGGVLCVAAGAGCEPQNFTATQFDGFRFSFECDDMMID